MAKRSNKKLRHRRQNRPPKSGSGTGDSRLDPKNASPTRRDRKILLLAETGLVTPEIVHLAFFADKTLEAARSALRRLAEMGYLRSTPLDGQRVYYRLTAKGSSIIGRGSQCPPPLKKPGKIKRYAASWHIHADRPGERMLFNPADYPDRFPVAGHSLPQCPFFIDRTEDHPRLGVILVDHNAEERRMPRRTVDLLGRFLQHGWFDGFISQAAFVVAILTFSEDRKRVFDRHVSRAIEKRLRYPLSRLHPKLVEKIPLLVQAYVIPGLDTIITHSANKGRQR